jgi:uncharacterized damage-inducible protein DinB
MEGHFRRFARYNKWANARLYEAVGRLTPEAFVAPRVGYFPSLMLTLNHILVGDRIWMSRFTRTPCAIKSLNQVLYPEFATLRVARVATDDQVLAYVDGLNEAGLSRPLTYQTLSDGKDTSTELGPTLTHFFNHQTHHRGQAHAMLSSTEVAPPSLDFIYFLREAN